jgi:hypothetical protein
MKNAPTGSAVISTLQAVALTATLVFLLAVIATGGCSSSSTNVIVTHSPTPTPTSSGPSPSPTPTLSPSPSPSPSPTAVNYVVMAYSSIAPTIDPTYGEIDGYGSATARPTTTPVPVVVSQVITVHCNQTIAFYNIDRLLPHTASLLAGPTPPPWPTFNNVNGTSASPQYTAGQLTPITYPQFSTGALGTFGSAGWQSLVYSTGSAAGVFFFGDYYFYARTPGMRTAINILCP